jgi:D-beta-D-heptose 7-phosphate kinase/D-beta-D-heptose 1-phosphate adenosyltransferase
MVDQHQAELAAAVERFRDLRVLVLGDPVLDTFVTGRPTRLCSEQPVPVLVREGEERRPGGAANTAANLGALGARPVLVGVVGADAAGEDLESCLRDAGVDTSGIVHDPDQPTCHKLRVLAGEHYVARIDTEPSADLSPEIEQELLHQLGTHLPQADLVVVSDYCLGTVSAAAMRLTCESAGARTVVLDARDLLRHSGARVNLATPNLKEAQEAAGLATIRPEPSPEDLAALAERLRQRLEAESIAVTMGAAGALVIRRDGTSERLTTRAVAARGEVGAGDSLVATAGLGLAAGLDVSAAVRLGMEAAALAVARPFTATVTAAQLSRRLRLAYLDGESTPASLDSDLESTLSSARAQGLRVVLTNGVFDLLHEGHVDLLRRARGLGDLLVVAINDDASSRHLKGEGRPINDVKEREGMLRALDCVDHVVVFGGPTAGSVVAAVRPDVYVKGDDHDIEAVPEAAAARELGAQLVSIPRARTVSTSQIIDRVLAVNRPGAGKV